MVAGIVLQAVPIFGSSTDVTVGLVDANRGEVPMEEDPVRPAGVTLGLKLKWGGNGEKK